MDKADELTKLVLTLAKWLEPAGGFKAYLFGSRVRGDHRSDSDVDVRIFLMDCKPDAAGTVWWTEQELPASVPAYCFGGDHVRACCAAGF
jgi:predicted nucleotidyltransferase